MLYLSGKLSICETMAGSSIMSEAPENTEQEGVENVFGF